MGSAFRAKKKRAFAESTLAANKDDVYFCVRGALTPGAVREEDLSGLYARLKQDSKCSNTSFWCPDRALIRRH